MVKNAITRFSTKTLGTLLSLFTVVIITYFLDVYQLAVWGVANSMIFIFSQINSLGYVQFIEKYFPNYGSLKKIYFLSKFLKTIFSTSIFWFLLMLVIGYLGYFEKYKIDNEIYLYIMITLLIVIETAIEILNKFFASIMKTINVDISSLFLYFVLRVVIFVSLLINEYSVFYLIFFQLILRFGLTIRLLFLIENNLIKSISKIIHSSILKNNFLNFGYTYKAFALKTLNTTFLNLLFLVFSLSKPNNIVAIYSICILVINSARPVFSSLSSLIFPIISNNIKFGKSNSTLMEFIFKVNSIVLGISILVSYLLFKFDAISEFFINKFEFDFQMLFVISIISSSIPMFYLPSYFDFLFSNKEKRLLKFVIWIYIIMFTIFSFLLTFDIVILIFYFAYELSILLFTIKEYNKTQNTKFSIKFSNFSIFSIIFIFIFNLNINFLLLLIIFVFSLLILISDLRTLTDELSKIRKFN